jgi:hypothetical protein
MQLNRRQKIGYLSSLKFTIDPVAGFQGSGSILGSGFRLATENDSYPDRFGKAAKGKIMNVIMSIQSAAIG